MNSYDLSRNFWNWAFDNPEKISTNHAAIYFFAIEHCNRLGWKVKFGFPSQMTMDAIGIKKHSTYIRYFNDLVEFGFFKLIQKSSNQYSSNIISLTIALPKKGEAMDKAMSMHGAKQKEYKQTSKQENKETIYRGFKHLKITQEDFNKLLKNFTEPQIDDILDQIENYKGNKNYNSLYLTALNWLKKRYPTELDKPINKLTPDVLHVARCEPSYAKTLYDKGHEAQLRKEGISWK